MILFGHDYRVKAIAKCVNGRIAGKHVIASGLEIDGIFAITLRCFQNAKRWVRVAAAHCRVFCSNQHVRRIANFPMRILRNPSNGTPPLHLAVFALGAHYGRVGDLGINRLLLLSSASNQEESTRTVSDTRAISRMIFMRNVLTKNAILSNGRVKLDAGIRKAVERLQECGIETFESCEGGSGHSYPEPTVRFHGTPEAGWRAIGVCLAYGLPILSLRRVWYVLDANEPNRSVLGDHLQEPDVSQV